MFTTIPPTLDAELGELENYVAQYRKGILDAEELKARRVPFGCYEQRRDGSYMVRIRATGGLLTPGQLRAVADLSRQNGGSLVHITTRQEFQIHDLRLDAVVPAMRSLLAAGLTSRGGGGNTVRNILVSPDAGVAVDEVFDPTPHALALADMLIAQPDSWLLPRKFKIAFSNSPQDGAYAQFNDLGFIARIRDGIQGFRVYAAGGMGNKPAVGHLLHDFVAADEVPAVALAVKRLFDAHGNRKNRNEARLRFLWRSLGEARFRKLYDGFFRAARGDGAAAWTLRALPEASVLAEPPAFPPVADEAAFLAWRRRYVEPQRQPGLFSVLLPVFLGNLDNADAIRLADLLEPLGPHVLRAAFGQNLRLRNIPEAYLGAVWTLARDIGFLSSAPRLLGNAISCTGADTCKLGICMSKGALTAVTATLRAGDADLDGIGDFRLGISGCPNTCGQHMLADLGFYGGAGRKGQRVYPSYGIVAGARSADGEARLALPVGRVSAHDLPRFIEEAVWLWSQNRNGYPSFAAYVDGDGVQQLRELAGRYADIPDFPDDPTYYRDWGAGADFSLLGRSAGECSAGLFDLVGIDLAKARRAAGEVEGAVVAESGAALYQVVLLSARALLITRDVDGGSDETVFGNFRKYFIMTGLVDSRFEAVLKAAHAGNAALVPLRNEVLALLAEVEQLYRAMDDSLRLPVVPVLA